MEGWIIAKVGDEKHEDADQHKTERLRQHVGLDDPEPRVQSGSERGEYAGPVARVATSDRPGHGDERQSDDDGRQLVCTKATAAERRDETQQRHPGGRMVRDRLADVAPARCVAKTIRETQRLDAVGEPIAADKRSPVGEYASQADRRAKRNGCQDSNAKTRIGALVILSAAKAHWMPPATTTWRQCYGEQTAAVARTPLPQGLTLRALSLSRSSPARPGTGRRRARSRQPGRSALRRPC